MGREISGFHGHLGSNGVSAIRNESKGCRQNDIRLLARRIAGSRHTRVERTVLPGDPGPDADGATLAVPQDGLTNIRVQGWDHIDVAPDGRTLTVYYWSGVDTCYGLADVLVSDADGVVTIELQVGTIPGVEVCIEMAQLYKTIVTLEAPVLGGGLGD